MSLLCSCYMVLTDKTAQTPELVCLFLVLTFTICWFQAAAALGAGKRKSSESTEAVAAPSSSPKVQSPWVFFLSLASASLSWSHEVTMVSFRDRGRSPLCFPRPSSPAWTPGLFEFVKTSFQNRHLHNRRVTAGQLIRPQPWPPTTSSTGARSKRKNMS